jgi:antiviral helicase SKI2
LITGDTQVNPAAPCLIMTTEILRSMLYKGADLVRDIEFVVFDECHYVNDTERGVVWEEVIIMLPDYVKLVFLSATTPNAIEFCDWIGRTKRKHIYVIRTNYRPVPLTHYLYTPSTGTNQKVMHVIMEGDTTSKTSGFLKKGYMDAVKALSPSSAANDSSTKKLTGGGSNNSKKPQAPQPKPAFKSGPKQSTWKNQGNKGQWIAFIRFLEREDLTPSVIFSFSKKKCEDIALSLRSLDLNSAAERAAVTGFTEQTIRRLNPSDAALPQVISICEMVKRGISTHHGGLLPILKEMVEILFSRNLIKVLFATETFAMGVNMPARSVAFSAVKKHDGTQFRNLLPGEYIQVRSCVLKRSLCFYRDSLPPVNLFSFSLISSDR